MTPPVGKDAALIERLRERDAKWQAQCDDWIAQARKNGGEVSDEQERIMRHTWEAEAADRLSVMEEALRRAKDHYDCRSELYTSAEDTAAGMAAILDTALTKLEQQETTGGN